MGGSFSRGIIRDTTADIPKNNIFINNSLSSGYFVKIISDADSRDIVFLESLLLKKNISLTSENPSSHISPNEIDDKDFFKKSYFVGGYKSNLFNFSEEKNNVIILIFDVYYYGGIFLHKISRMDKLKSFVIHKDSSNNIAFSFLRGTEEWVDENNYDHLAGRTHK